MKKVFPSIYKNLTPRQRVVACLEALARGDEAERLRLIESCPKVTCRQTDPHFSTTMEALMGLAMAVEADLKECALRFFLAIRLDPENASGHLQDFANIQQAWRTTLKALGIDEHSMSLAGPPSSPLFEHFANLIPEPKTERSAEMTCEMLNLFNK